MSSKISKLFGMKLRLSLLLIAFCLSTAYADVVSFKAPEVNDKIRVSKNLILTDWQAVMSCHFDVKGVRKESIRYPQTILKKTATDEYSLFVKKGSLSEMLPGWRLLTCAYKIILIGKNTELERSIMGELYLLGQESGEMDSNDLKDIQNKEFVAKVIADKTREISLVISPEGGIESN